jgi:chromosomal replication initiator protein
MMGARLLVREKMQTPEQVLWQTILSELELSLSEANFKTFVKPSVLLEINEENIVILVQNVFARSQFEKKFDGDIKRILLQNGFSSPTIDYTINSKRPSQVVESLSPLMPEAPQTSKIFERPSSNLNPNFTMQRFVVGKCNDMAYNSALAVIANPGTKYNPLFIYGGVGLGKTHLIQAVGNEILQQNPNKRVLYTSSEAFTNEFLECIRFGKNKQAFSDKYRKVDVLIVDDIQFIAGKESTQEEFFHTFESLDQRNKQIILSSDRHPEHIQKLTDRMKSRFLKGMTVDIGLPDYETRYAIIKQYASYSGIDIPNDVADYLADNIKTNVREIEGALNKLLAHCEMQNIVPDIELAREITNSGAVTYVRRPTPKQLIEKVAQYYDVKLTDIYSKNRQAHIKTPRQVASYMLRYELNMTFPKIASVFEQDHSTVMNSVRKIELAVKLDMMMRQQVGDIKEKIYE